MPAFTSYWPLFRLLNSILWIHQATVINFVFTYNAIYYNLLCFKHGTARSWQHSFLWWCIWHLTTNAFTHLFVYTKHAPFCISKLSKLEMSHVEHHKTIYITKKAYLIGLYINMYKFFLNIIFLYPVQFFFEYHNIRVLNEEFYVNRTHKLISLYLFSKLFQKASPHLSKYAAVTSLRNSSTNENREIDFR